MTRTVDHEQDTAWPIGIDRAEETTARGEHLRVIVTQDVYVFLGNFAASSILVVGAWNRIPDEWLLIWLAVFAVFNVLRLAVSRRFPEGRLEAAEVGAWDRRVVASVLFSGCIWGFAGGFFFLPGEPDHNFFLALLIVGMAAAAATSLSYHRIAYPVFFLPAITPITLSLVLEKDTAETAVGLVMPFYFMLMYLLSRHIYQAGHDSILAQIRNQHLAYYDALTGLANRRAFEEVLEKEWLRALRYQHRLSLVIADIDNFKHYNDTFGHAVGDEVLHAVAQMIEGRIRRGIDLAARIGGEEFGLILPETDIAGAHTLSEQILRECQQIKSESGRHTEVITLSLGISVCLPNEDASVETLFEHADAALRKAKQRGKNRVIALPACTVFGAVK